MFTSRNDDIKCIYAGTKDRELHVEVLGFGKLGQKGINQKMIFNGVLLFGAITTSDFYATSLARTEHLILISRSQLAFDIISDAFTCEVLSSNYS